MNAYIHYLLVRPDYQLKGIGRELLERVKQHYIDYLKIVVITEESITEFYENNGFELKQSKRALFISEID